VKRGANRKRKQDQLAQDLLSIIDEAAEHGARNPKRTRRGQAAHLLQKYDVLDESAYALYAAYGIERKASRKIFDSLKHVCQLDMQRKSSTGGMLLRIGQEGGLEDHLKKFANGRFASVDAMLLAHKTICFEGILCLYVDCALLTSVVGLDLNISDAALALCSNEQKRNADLHHILCDEIEGCLPKGEPVVHQLGRASSPVPEEMEEDDADDNIPLVKRFPAKAVLPSPSSPKAAAAPSPIQTHDKPELASPILSPRPLDVYFERKTVEDQAKRIDLLMSEALHWRIEYNKEVLEATAARASVAALKDENTKLKGEIASARLDLAKTRQSMKPNKWHHGVTCRDIKLHSVNVQFSVDGLLDHLRDTHASVYVDCDECRAMAGKLTEIQHKLKHKTNEAYVVRDDAVTAELLRARA
jgi:hypothetical protein